MLIKTKPLESMPATRQRVEGKIFAPVRAQALDVVLYGRTWPLFTFVDALLRGALHITTGRVTADVRARCSRRMLGRKERICL